MNKKKITLIVADENKQVKIMLQKAMKGVEEPLKSLFGSHYKPIYGILFILVLIAIFFIVIFAIIQSFL